MNTKTTTIAATFSIGAMLSELISHFLDNKYQFVAIAAVVILDSLFGMAKALFLKNFETQKTFKSVYRLVGFWFLLATVLLIEKGFPFASFLSEAILLPIILFQVISIIKNMNIVGLISNETVTRMLANIDKHKTDK